MAVHKIPAHEALAQWPNPSSPASLATASPSSTSSAHGPSTGPLAIDARSPGEYALDHLPFATNWPVLDDAQRQQVGTIYKQVNPFEANKLGAAMVSENIAKHLRHHVQNLDRNWKPFVYCWRGGQRSGALAHVLGQIGFSVRLIEGGYKAFREAMLQDLARLAPGLQMVLIHGATGCGKTRLLQHLKALGAQVLDLEGLACHRSSVLGHVPGQAQPSQKHFDMLLWQNLRSLDPTRPVFVEAESKRVGAVTIHPSVFEAMQRADVVNLEAPLAARVNLLCEDYRHFIDDLPSFAARLAALRPIVGARVHEQWLASCEQGQWSTMVEDLLVRHYDPNYIKAGDRLYPKSSSGHGVKLIDLSEVTLRQCAEQLIQSSKKA